MNTEYCGTIKGGAAVSLGGYNYLRLLVTFTNGTDWTYLYIAACNYRFHKEDAVSWNHEGKMFWYSQGRTITFDLLNVELRIQ